MFSDRRQLNDEAALSYPLTEGGERIQSAFVVGRVSAFYRGVRRLVGWM